MTRLGTLILVALALAVFLGVLVVTARHETRCPPGPRCLAGSTP